MPKTYKNILIIKMSSLGDIIHALPSLYALRKAYPNHSIQGEETGLHAGTGEEGKDYLWIIDPLDGTTNFLRGVPHFAVSIACKYRGRLEHEIGRAHV